jgi:hypothetical protein
MSAGRFVNRGRPLRVIHAPVEIAGLASASAYGLRELGVHAQSVAPPHQFDYMIAPDVVLPPGRLARLARVGPTLARCDVIHLHFGLSFLQDRFGGADARALRRLGKRVVMEFHGDDVRLPSVEGRRNPYYVSDGTANEEQALARMRRWSDITSGHAIVSDHALDDFLAPHFQHIHAVGQRVDTRRYAAAPPRAAASTPVVVHAPSNPAVKGTELLRQAVNALRRDGLRFQYVEVRGLSQREALRIYAKADLVVDQLRLGSYGIFAVEAMSLAKPVLCYIRPAIVPTYPADLPVINTNPDTLTDVLREWLTRPEERHDRGLASRAYAEREHDVRVVARRLIDVYEALPRG